MNIPEYNETDLGLGHGDQKRITVNKSCVEAVSALPTIHKLLKEVWDFNECLHFSTDK